MISGEMRTLLDNLLTCQQEGCPCAGSRARKALSDAIEAQEAKLEQAEALVGVAERKFNEVMMPSADFRGWYKIYGPDVQEFRAALQRYRAHT